MKRRGEPEGHGAVEDLRPEARALTDDPTEPDEFAERLARSSGGRALLTVLIVVTLAGIGVTTLAGATAQGKIGAWAPPYLHATGLYQDWAIFSPNPRQETSYVVARVEHRDGSVSTWPIEISRGVASLSDYRWHKYEEMLWLGDENAWARPDYARWIVARDREVGGQPILVTLVRRWAPNLPPGPGPARGPWRESVLYTQVVSP